MIVKSIAIALLCLLVSMTALAIEPNPSVSFPITGAYEVVSKPSQKELIEGYYASGLPRATGTVLVAYDEKGNVLGVKLGKSTGSSSLDKVIMAWAAQLKLKAGTSGISSIPFTFAPY
jgi:hypothetical protein